jgi:hypothetical protein
MKNYYIKAVLLLIFSSLFTYLYFSVYVVITQQYTMWGLQFIRLLFFLFLIGVVLLVLPVSLPDKNKRKKEAE